ncbi:hypothetical protein BKA70DRAFT_1425890 [Coprinopsis sp. MPI-PUGE-AT-0042]|nr:hypothetical protein BKA70DRAFT_1425890 [Coprinopsis sp. MPI-PUGE-AT-0042]
MASNFANFLSFLRKAVYYQRCTQYVNVAALAFLVLDYFQTLPSEVELVWQNRWALIKVLFLLSRYLPFIYGPLTLWVGLQSGATLEACTLSFGASSFLIVISMILAEGIMFVRLYALSGHNKKMLAWIVFQLLAIQSVVITFFSLFVRSVKVIKSPLPSVPGCIPSKFDSHKLMIVFAAIVASQLIMMLISSWIGIQKYKHSNSPILVVFYRDGFFYFLSLTVVTIGNIIFDRIGPPELRFMLTLPQGILHSVLSCRLTLHIYDFAKKELNAPHTGAQTTKTGLDFAEVTPSMMGSQQTDTTRLPERGEGSSRSISQSRAGN